MSCSDEITDYDIKVEELNVSKKKASECFKGNINKDLTNCIDLADKIILKIVKNKDVEKELRYACVGCNFSSHDKLPIVLHQMIAHRDEDYRIVGIRCEPCKDGEMHTMHYAEVGDIQQGLGLPGKASL